MNNYQEAKYNKNILKKKFENEFLEKKKKLESLLQDLILIKNVDQNFNILEINEVLNTDYILKYKIKSIKNIAMTERKLYYIFDGENKIYLSDIIENLKKELIKINSKIQSIDIPFLKSNDMKISFRNIEHLIKIRLDDLLLMNKELFDILDKLKNNGNIENNKDEIDKIIINLISNLGFEESHRYLISLNKSNIIISSDLVWDYIFTKFKK